MRASISAGAASPDSVIAMRRWLATIRAQLLAPSHSRTRQPVMEIPELPKLPSAQARLVAAVQELSLARTIPAIQNIVRSAAREIAQADGATFVLREGDQCHYVDEDAISPLWKGQRFPMSACISGWAMLHQQHAVLPDIYSDPRIPADAYRPTFVKSLVMVPIRSQAPIGAIGAYWATPHAASAEEVALLRALADTTAVAFENVRVYSELEHRVAQRTEQLEALNSELESFSYSVSHDLRAPLRAVNGYAELLTQEIGENLPGKSAHYLHEVRSAVAHMNQLIEDLLELSKVARHAVRREETDLAAIARATVQRLQKSDPGRQVDVAIPERLSATCDSRLLGIVLENLLANAWKFSAKTERARIEVGSSVQADGQQVYFVRDNGAGFNPRYASKLFSPFQRLHSAKEFPGTGVGLATVQRIINRHGGRIWAEAEVGKGATFFFTCDGPKPSA
jgi:signal transduction histidine kinase